MQHSTYEYFQHSKCIAKYSSQQVITCACDTYDQTKVFGARGITVIWVSPIVIMNFDTDRSDNAAMCRWNNNGAYVLTR